MKQINDYITEKFKISSKTVEKRYSCNPKTTEELKEIISERLKKNKNADLNDIDVSEITNMRSLFWKLDPHNIDISKWDVSNVTDMSYMFYYCINFNSDISEWDVSNVTDMKYILDECKEFNADISNWDISHVEDMEYAFNSCEKLSCDLDKWKPNNSKAVIYGIRTFRNCPKLKKPSWYKYENN